MMFENLRSELDKKHITMVSVAKVIGCTDKSLQNKLKGRTEFTLSEIFKINTELLPEFDLKYLFSRK